MQLVTIMRVTGKITSETDMELCSGLLVMKSILETGSTIFKVGSAHTFGQIQVLKTNCCETDMLVIGKMDLGMEKVHSTIQMVVNTRVTGSKITRRDTEFLLLKMELNMMVPSKKIG